MTEIPKNTHFVGFSEAPKPKEMTISPEQKLVADVMRQSGEVLENKILNARGKAGEQLKKLHGKELVGAGLKQMGHGVWEIVKSELKWSFGLGLLGSAASQIHGDNYYGEDRATRIGILSGIVVGYETAGLKYNKKIAEKKNLPKTEWYDWVVGNIGQIGSTTIMKNYQGDSRIRSAGVIALQLLSNPISMGGLRNVAMGLWQMRKGK